MEREREELINLSKLKSQQKARVFNEFQNRVGLIEEEGFELQQR